MSRLNKALNQVPLALCYGLMLSSLSSHSAVLAQGDGRLPPPPMPTAINGAPATVLGAPTGMPPAASYASAPAAPAAPVAPPTNVAELKVEPGPLEEKRRALLGRIMDAKNQGMGTTVYMMAFDAIEQQAKSGDTEENISKRITAISGPLEDQFKRSATLKVQRAAPPVAASSSGGMVPAPLGGSVGSPPGNTDTAALIQKLQNKFGGQIPAGLQDKIPGGDPSALLKNPEVMDILKGLKK